jgi:hypothetical protein
MTNDGDSVDSPQMVAACIHDTIWQPIVFEGGMRSI